MRRVLYTVSELISFLAVLMCSGSAFGAPGEFVISDAVITESDATINLTVNRINGVDGTVTVDYVTNDGSATAGADYVTTSGTLTFAPGETTKLAPVETKEDSVWELDETFTVDLSNPTGGATIADGSGLATIVDDDPGDLYISDAVITEVDGTVSLTVQRSTGVDEDVSFDYATSDGTAVAGADYLSASGSLTILAGQTSVAITVSVLEDSEWEIDESFYVTLSNATGNTTITDDVGEVLIVDDDPGDLFISDAFMTEGDGTMSLTVERTAGYDEEVTFDYATSDGTATSGSDYGAASGTITIPAGSVATFIPVTIMEDTQWEEDETFTVTLSNASGDTTITDAVGVGTILDDDTKQPGELLISDETITETDGTVSLTVDRVNGADDTVTVDWATSDGSATAPDDYVAANGTLVFDPGETTAAIVITINDDASGEVDETLNVTLSNPMGGATISDGTGLVTIIDDEPGEIAFSVSNYSVSENDATATITATRSNGTAGAVTVDYGTSDGSATAGIDYTATSGSLAWVDDDGSDKTFTVVISDDADFEGNETVNLALSNVAGGATLGNATATLTILDDESPLPGDFLISDADATESAGTMTFTVERRNGSDGAVTVDYASSDGTATASTDYTAVGTSTLSWADGDATIRAVIVPILDDAVGEADETLFVTLSGATGGATIVDGVATGTILDDEPGEISLSMTGYSVSEAGGTATITVTRTNGTAGSVSVDYATNDGTATSGADYASSSGTLVWGDGDASDKTFTVNILDDSSYEVDETLELTLSNASGGATILTGSSTLTILDDESPRPGTISFDASSYQVDENAGTVTVTVNRTGGSDGAISVDYETSEQTATGGIDFTATSGTISFADGETTPKQTSISILDDSTYEGDEWFAINLSNPTGGASIGTASAVIDIIDDDSAMPGVIAVSETTLEHDERGNTLSVVVTRTGGMDGAVGVSYATADGTATSGSDYTAASGDLIWPDGDDADKTIDIPVLDDDVYEGDETFSFVLSSVSGGATLSDDTATITILDDEPPPMEVEPGTVEFAVTRVTVTEADGAAELVVTRSGGSDGAITVDVASIDDSAVEGDDYDALSTTVSWADGEDGNRAVEISILDDDVPEDEELFAVILENAGGGAMLGSDGVAEVVILDDDELDEMPDTGQSDAGQYDAGQYDAGQSDAGQYDAGQSDAGQPDFGDDSTGDDSDDGTEGCGCAAADGGPPDLFGMLLLVVVIVVRRRRRR